MILPVAEHPMIHPKYKLLLTSSHCNEEKGRKFEVRPERRRTSYLKMGYMGRNWKKYPHAACRVLDDYGCVVIQGCALCLQEKSKLDGGRPPRLETPNYDTGWLCFYTFLSPHKVLRP
jgi:hypothetical protein